VIDPQNNPHYEDAGRNTIGCGDANGVDPNKAESGSTARATVIGALLLRLGYWRRPAVWIDRRLSDHNRILLDIIGLRKECGPGGHEYAD